MKPRHYFPLGKAYGDAFCNRIEETKRLAGNIENGKHTFLIAPRRYGKSSLCERVFEQTNLPWIKLDFYLAVNTKDVERITINGVNELVGKAIGKIDKLSALLKKYTKRLQPKFIVGNKNFKLELEITKNSSPAENIVEALVLLDRLLQEKNKLAVLLFDEFQEIGSMTEGKGVEGAFRHVGQDTRNLAFIFSGSNPHLLHRMFEDERRPLYKLCRKLLLNRIDEVCYQEHLKKAAKIMWGKYLDQDAFARIMDLSERHPYYVNYLCDVLWSEYENLPQAKQVDEAWDSVVEEERSDLLKDFFSLAENQRKLLMYIANGKFNNIYSNEAAKAMDIPTSSISRSLNALIEKDYIEKTGDVYRLIVPAYKTLLKINQ